MKMQIELGRKRREVHPGNLRPKVRIKLKRETRKRAQGT